MLKANLFCFNIESCPNRKHFDSSLFSPPSKGNQNPYGVDHGVYYLLGTFHCCSHVDVFSLDARRIFLAGMSNSDCAKYRFRSITVWNLHKKTLTNSLNTSSGVHLPIRHACLGIRKS